MTKLIEKRFAELESQIIDIESTKQQKYNAYSGSYTHIDSNLLLNWCVKVKNLLLNACGENSLHLSSFVEAEKPSAYSDNFETLCRIKAVFKAAKEDYEGGYLNSVKNLIHAEVFDSELEQASELLDSGYSSAAAVIAGVVLETTIRNLCLKQGIEVGKLEKMNADLTKADTYNILQQKRITALAAIRNSAAHGKTEEFSKEDVKAMIVEIERFVASILS